MAPDRTVTRLTARVGVHSLMLPSLALLTVMVLIPLGALAYFSLLADVNRQGSFTGSNYSHMTTTGLYRDLYVKSVLTALLVTALTAFVAWPAGWALSRVRSARKPLLLTLVIVPYLTSYLLLIYAIFVLFAANGPLMTLLDTLHVASAQSSIIYTPTATILMFVYENLPIMLLVLYAASERIDDDLIAAARSLGAGRLAIFSRVVLPLSLPSLLAGTTLVFIPVAGAFVEPQILGGANGLLVGNVINDQVTLVNNQPFGAALSLVLLAVIVLVVGALNLLGRLPRGAQRVRARLAEAAD